MAQLKDLIVNGPSRFIGDVYATTFTGNLAGNASTATSATNAGTVGGLSVHSGRNNEANKIVRTDGNGYLQVGYINSSDGHEKNASSPTYVWGSNSSDSYLRSYQTSSLSVKYATTSGSCNGNAATATKATQDGNGNVITSTYLPLSGGILTGNMRIRFGDTDKFIMWDYDGDETAGASWRIGAKGTGSGNTNYFCIESGTNDIDVNIWHNVLNIGQNDLVVYFSQTPKVGSTNVSLDGHSHDYLPLTGGTITGVITSSYESGSWINGVNNAIIKATYTGYGAVLSMPVKDGRVSLSSYPLSDNNIYFGYATATQISAGINYHNTQMYWDAANNNLHADVFTGALSGNASTATKWATSRVITVTGSVTGSVSLDGSADVTLETTTNHTHTGSEVILTGYSHHDSYETINETDTVNQAIAKLEGAISGLEDLLASI